MDSLSRKFEEIKKTYFPRWRSAGEWQCRRGEHISWHGQCDDSRKILFIGFIPEDEEEIVILHEAVHAVAGPYHGKRFLRRFEQAAQTARLIGDEKMARRIENEIDGYKNRSYRVTAAFVYGSIEDAVRDQPQATYEEVVTWLVRDCGVDLESFEKRWKRARRVYEEAQAFVAQEAEVRKMFEANRR